MKRPHRSPTRRGSSISALALAVALPACVHTAALVAAPPPVCVPRPAVPRSAAEVEWDGAGGALAEGHYDLAGQLFARFANDFPGDSRVPRARIQQAYATLLQPEASAALAKAQAIAAQLAPPAEPADREALAALLILIASRQSAQRDLRTRTDLLSSCQQRMAQLPDFERDRSASRSSVARLQQELLRKEQALEDVKQRLLEIQQLAAEMLGGAKPAVPPLPRPPLKPAATPSHSSPPPAALPR